MEDSRPLWPSVCSDDDGSAELGLLMDDPAISVVLDGSARDIVTAALITRDPTVCPGSAISVDSVLCGSGDMVGSACMLPVNSACGSGDAVTMGSGEPVLAGP